MPEGKRKSAAADKGGEGGEAKAGKADRRRLSYLKTRSQELKKELQANKEESEAIRQKLGKSGKRKAGAAAPGAAGGDDDED